MGFEFTVIAPLLPSHCGFSLVFGCGVSFLPSSSVFLWMIVQQLVVILVFSQEGVRARPSTLPSWLRFSWIFISHVKTKVFKLARISNFFSYFLSIYSLGFFFPFFLIFIFVCGTSILPFFMQEARESSLMLISSPLLPPSCVIENTFQSCSLPFLHYHHHYLVQFSLLFSLKRAFRLYSLVLCLTLSIQSLGNSQRDLSKMGI